MDTYTRVLEFFMENGVQLTPDQMDELKGVCEGFSVEQLSHAKHNLDNFNDKDKAKMIRYTRKELQKEIKKGRPISDISDNDIADTGAYKGAELINKAEREAYKENDKWNKKHNKLKELSNKIDEYEKERIKNGTIGTPDDTYNKLIEKERKLARKLEK